MAQKYIDRLVKEWKNHGKIIIACDFDDTLHPWTFPDSDYERVFSLLKAAKEIGAYIVIFTAGKPGRYQKMVDYCQGKGLEIDTVNQNPVELPYGNNGKIYANIFIDDRAGLNESLSILEAAIITMRDEIQ